MGAKAKGAGTISPWVRGEGGGEGEEVAIGTGDGVGVGEGVATPLDTTVVDVEGDFSQFLAVEAIRATRISCPQKGNKTFISKT